MSHSATQQASVWLTLLPFLESFLTHSQILPTELSLQVGPMSAPEGLLRMLQPMIGLRWN